MSTKTTHLFPAQQQQLDKVTGWVIEVMGYANRDTAEAVANKVLAMRSGYWNVGYMPDGFEKYARIAAYECGREAARRDVELQLG